MSGKSSSPAEWWSLLEPAPEELFYKRGDPEDPRLGEVVTRWTGGPIELKPGQPVLIGFPCDEGVRRNGGRPGAALAPNAIREQLYRFTTTETIHPERLLPKPPKGWLYYEVHELDVDLGAIEALDGGNVRLAGRLESDQERLGEIVGSLLRAGAFPIVLGGGHETAFGHYLGYAKAALECAIINVDAHLDVRPYPRGGHSGSPFRQAIEHPTHPLKPHRYHVIGAQQHAIARAHWDYVPALRGSVYLLNDCSSTIAFFEAMNSSDGNCETIMVTVDADAFRQSDVPGTSAPSPVGLEGRDWPEIAWMAGCRPSVRSLELVEVNPLFDRDNQTTRWAALGIRQFLIGLDVRKQYPAFLSASSASLRES